MERREDPKRWLTEIGGLYGAVIVFVTLSFLVLRLDSFFAAGGFHTSTPAAAEETAGPFGAYPR